MKRSIEKETVILWLWGPESVLDVLPLLWLTGPVKACQPTKHQMFTSLQNLSNAFLLFSPFAHFTSSSLHLLHLSIDFFFPRIIFFKCFLCFLTKNRWHGFIYLIYFNFSFANVRYVSWMFHFKNLSPSFPLRKWRTPPPPGVLPVTLFSPAEGAIARGSSRASSSRSGTFYKFVSTRFTKMWRFCSLPGRSSLHTRENSKNPARNRLQQVSLQVFL